MNNAWSKICLIVCFSIASYGCRTSEKNYIGKVDRSKATTCLKLQEANLTTQELRLIKHNARIYLNTPFSDETICIRVHTLNDEYRIIKTSLPVTSHISPLWFLSTMGKAYILNINIKELRNDSVYIKQRVAAITQNIPGMSGSEISLVNKYFIQQSQVFR
ncbi:hypothetical protein [Hymenobacter sp. CRA2]|uniref:hypothetical protein n=1 Tax=Hymenobacter sp. CRA2 TaxID=1955620 RepID=UPI00111759F3|nr:hypothetical protein [Hymenobacter sp. CRA2]